MPEMSFQVRWPDGAEDWCYSPSSIITEYFTLGESYPVEDFLRRSRTAYGAANARVKAKFGLGCGHALSQLALIEGMAKKYLADKTARVFIESFRGG